MGDSVLDIFPAIQKFSANQTVELTALPNFGYRFTGWIDSDGIIQNDLTISVLMTCTKQYTATFTPIKHRIVTVASPVSSGEIIMEPAQPEDGYQLGTEVILTAKPAKGFSFKEWLFTDINASGKTITYIVSSDDVITAIFVEKSSGVWTWVLGGLGFVILVAGLYIFLLRKR